MNIGQGSLMPEKHKLGVKDARGNQAGDSKVWL